ncbi:DUF1850 domain-containing protein [Cytobacillus spongiae]|jgi:hypothetical protein|uniref:DUF1850 domain-containing protein n=1 Tax=Cytobacillus spongiae TaxID=2901381 RepID=UPI001F33EDA5|nr:DUF1850 domain-containing protein [Cytobacillus spongiae]UII57058.1 DUF1850 domain-containing protein [Cytobacillus spongiae]
MKKRKIQMLLFLTPLIVLLIAFVLLIPYQKALVLQYQNTGKVLAYISLSNTENFKIKYTHSIHLSDVVESYTVTEDMSILQYELMYEDFAIGMPSDAAEGEVFEQKDGKYYIKNMERIFPSFDMRIGKVRANHRVIYNEKEYPIGDVIDPGTWIRIKVEKISMLQQLKGVNILES